MNSIYENWLRKAIVLCLSVAFSSASSISNSSISLTPSSAQSDVRENDYKAGAGFLFVATFFLMGDYALGGNKFPGNRNSPGAFEAEIATLRDRMSILEKVSFQQDKAYKIDSDEATFPHVPPICISEKDSSTDSSSSSLTYRTKVMDSIKRALKFIEVHLDQMHTIEPAFALTALKVVDDKYGGELQKSYPMSEWISQICGSFHDLREAESCKSLTSIWKPRQNEWKNQSIIHHYGLEFKSVGSDVEVIWGRLNGECQLALLTRCEVPYVCERTLFDTKAHSQYMLTHQLLQRILTEMGACRSARNLLDPEVNHRLCAKIYKEAQLIAALKTPEILRDLFAEQIGMCGYAGYPNFLREDFLDLILSWQSKSEYGCFLRDTKGKSKFMSTDKSVKRLSTETERAEGMGVESDEQCLPHFTSVSLTALATYWDYIEEKC